MSIKISNSKIVYMQRRRVWDFKWKKSNSERDKEI